MPIRFASSAIRFLDGQPHNIRSKLISDVVWLRDYHDTVPDLEDSLFRFKVYRDLFQWILFLIDADHMLVANIGVLAEEPHFWRH